LPAEVDNYLRTLGQRVRLARLRRGWSAAELAAKAGIHRNTLAALESGRAGTALGVAFAVLWSLGLDAPIAQLADPELDAHGKALEAARRPQRAGKSVKAEDYDF